MVLKTATPINPAYEIMHQETGETALDVGLPILIRKMFRYKKEILKMRIASYEEKYGMTLKEFEKACKDGRIADPYSYEVENDGWEWDSAVTELKDTEELEQWLE